MLSPVQNEVFPEVITNEQGEVEAAVFLASPEKCPNITMIRAFAAAWDKHHAQMNAQIVVTSRQPDAVAWEVRHALQTLSRTLGRRVRLVHKHDHRGQEGEPPRGFYYGISKEEWEKKCLQSA